MFEINWGQPLVITATTESGIQKISTIEQARYMLRRKWPVDDTARSQAIHAINSAMECMGSVDHARAAFLAAAQSAGLNSDAASA